MFHLNSRNLCLMSEEATKHRFYIEKHTKEHFLPPGVNISPGYFLESWI